MTNAQCCLFCLIQLLSTFTYFLESVFVPWVTVFEDGCPGPLVWHWAQASPWVLCQQYCISELYLNCNSLLKEMSSGLARFTVRKLVRYPLYYQGSYQFTFEICIVMQSRNKIPMTLSDFLLTFQIQSSSFSSCSLCLVRVALRDCVCILWSSAVFSLWEWLTGDQAWRESYSYLFPYLAAALWSYLLLFPHPTLQFWGAGFSLSPSLTATLWWSWLLLAPPLWVP